MRNHGEALLNLEAFVEVFELGAFELSSIVCNDSPWKAKTAYNISYSEINDLFGDDSGPRL